MYKNKLLGFIVLVFLALQITCVAFAWGNSDGAVPTQARNEKTFHIYKKNEFREYIEVKLIEENKYLYFSFASCEFEKDPETVNVPSELRELQASCTPIGSEADENLLNRKKLQFKRSEILKIGVKSVVYIGITVIDTVITLPFKVPALLANLIFFAMAFDFFHLNSILNPILHFNRLTSMEKITLQEFDKDRKVIFIDPPVSHLVPSLAEMMKFDSYEQYYLELTHKALKE